MRKVYIYALTTKVFPDNKSYEDNCQKTAIFYVGKTCNPTRRKKEHIRDAKNNLNFPCSEKVRNLGDNWDMEIIACADESKIRDLEEYYMIKFTCDGHNLLNLKRGDRIRKMAKEIGYDFEKLKVKGPEDYSKAMNILSDNRMNKIELREFRQIEGQIKRIKRDSKTGANHYDLNGKIYVAERGLKEAEVISLILPSVQRMLQRVAAL